MSQNENASENRRPPSAGGKRRGLGRGLGALIVNTEAPPSVTLDELDAVTSDSVRAVPVNAIRPNPRQPRAHFDETALDELAASIKEHGIIQPLIVTQTAGSSQALGDTAIQYDLVAGERRWRAAQRAALREVPVIVREASPEQIMAWALVENVQREDLSPLEEAAAYRTLMDELGLTQAEVADRVGKSRSAVANTVRLLQLSPAVQEALVNGHISAGHARALLALADYDQLLDTALNDVVAEMLNVRQTEALVKHLLAIQAAPAIEDSANDDEVMDADPEMQAQLSYMENRFQSALGTRVNLKRGADGSGRLVVHFYNDNDLEQIYRLIAGEEELI